MPKKFIRSAGHAARGIRHVWREERNFRIQVVISILLLAVLIVLNFTYEELCFVLLAMVLVLSAEMLNTILEDTLDAIEPNFKPAIGHLKDVTAGVVLVLSGFAGAIGLLTFMHHFGLL